MKNSLAYQDHLLLKQARDFLKRPGNQNSIQLNTKWNSIHWKIVRMCIWSWKNKGTHQNRRHLSQFSSYWLWDVSSKWCWQIWITSTSNDSMNLFMLSFHIQFRARAEVARNGACLMTYQIMLMLIIGQRINICHFTRFVFLIFLVPQVVSIYYIWFYNILKQRFLFCVFFHPIFFICSNACF